MLINQIKSLTIIDVYVTFMQEVTADDLSLHDGAIYRKVVSFVGSPKI